MVCTMVRVDKDTVKIKQNKQKNKLILATSTWAKWEGIVEDCVQVETVGPALKKSQSKAYL